MRAWECSQTLAQTTPTGAGGGQQGLSHAVPSRVFLIHRQQPARGARAPPRATSSTALTPAQQRQRRWQELRCQLAEGWARPDAERPLHFHTPPTRPCAEPREGGAFGRPRPGALSPVGARHAAVAVAGGLPGDGARPPAPVSRGASCERCVFGHCRSPPKPWHAGRYEAKAAPAPFSPLPPCDRYNCHGAGRTPALAAAPCS
jgi:hypothetical protein